MKKNYPYLKQFFEQHKTLHSYKSFVRHRSHERLRQLDEICSCRPYKTRFEEFLKLDDKETSAHIIYKKMKSVQESVGDFFENEKTGNVVGCLALLSMVILFILFLASLKIFLKVFIVLISVVFVLYCLIFPFDQFIDSLGIKNLYKIAKIYPYCYYGYHCISKDNSHNRSSLSDRLNKPYGISKKFAEDCDLCFQKFIDDYKLFFSENQKDISLIINFYKQNYYKDFKREQPKVTQNIKDIYNCFYYHIDFLLFSFITKEHINTACDYIQHTEQIVQDQSFQIDFSQIENRIQNRYKDLDYNPKNVLIYATWICFNILCIGFTFYLLKTKHDLKSKAIAPLYQKSYAQYEKDLKKWENGVFVEIKTSMTDYYRLGEDLSYEYRINDVNVSTGCIIAIPEDNKYYFEVSVTEYDETFDDYGHSYSSETIYKQDLRGYRVPLETYVHENSKNSTQGYARFMTVFTLSLPSEENKPKEPKKSDFNDEVKVTFLDAFISAIGID